jgi:hypothetical protein
MTARMPTRDTDQEMTDMTENSGNWLRPWEIEQLIMALLDSRGDRGFTEDEAFRLIRWAEQTRIAGAFLTGLLAGTILVELPAKGEPIFRKASTPRRKSA